MRILSAVLLSLWVLLAGCDRGVVVEEQVVDVACAMCMYKMPEANGCYWAAEIDGQPHIVVGNVPKDHVMHAPDGMCNMERKARVSGRIEHDRFYADSFELLPAEDVPEAPRFTEADEH